MNHNACEKEMIDTVNRHAGKARTQVGAIITKKDTATLKTGLKRMALALLTAAIFAVSVFSFIAVATAPGYLAVALFIMAIMTLACGFVFLYAQGISNTERNGDDK